MGRRGWCNREMAAKRRKKKKKDTETAPHTHAPTKTERVSEKAEECKCVSLEVIRLNAKAHLLFLHPELGSRPTLASPRARRRTHQHAFQNTLC